MNRYLAIVLLWCLGLASLGRGESPVYFSDIRLKEAVEEALGVVDPTASDMLGLVSLVVGYKYIEDLTGLEYAKNLEELVLNDNRIRSLGPLSGLSKLRRLDVSDNYVLSDIRGISGLVGLEELDLHRNNISDVSALGGLVGLRRLVLRDNALVDIGPLGGLGNLEELVLRVNGIRDISCLVGLRRLRVLDLSSNPLDDAAYCDDLWEICRGNPGLYPWYDVNPRGPRWVEASDGEYSGYVRVRWSEVCNGPLMTSRYCVYRSDSIGGQREAISGWGMGLEYEDRTAVPGVKYYYWVQADPYGDGSGAGQISGPDVGWR